MSFKNLFNPNSIAIVGIEEQNFAYSMLTNLLDYGYKGKIYPVSSTLSEVDNLSCFKSIEEVQDNLDLVCIFAQPESIISILGLSAQKSAKYAIIVSGGFGEKGDDGAKIQKEILVAAKNLGIRLIGPNSLGVVSTRNQLNLSLALAKPIRGDIAFISQSGAFLTAGLDIAMAGNLGFSHFATLGNKSDLNENELLEYFIEDSETKVIGMYLEDFVDGKRFIELAKKTNKPIVVFKAGESDLSVEAITSHTGSMTGSFQVFETAMRENGIAIAKDIDELFQLLKGFSWIKQPLGNRVSIITNAGGPGAIATDFLVKNNLQLAQIDDHNPLDLLADADASKYVSAVERFAQDEEVDSILVLLTPQSITDLEGITNRLAECIRKQDKPIIPIFLGGTHIEMSLKVFNENKILCFDDISEAVNILAKLTFNSNNRISQPTLDQLGVKKGLNRDLVAKFVGNISQALPEDITIKLAEEIGINLPKQLVVENISDAKKFAEGKYPVVIKATSEDISHKTNEKAIYLNIENKEDLEESFRELRHMLKENHKIESPRILIQEQLADGTELFVGVKRDGASNVYEIGSKGFGHLLTFGEGGIYTEIYKDLAYSLVPTNKERLVEAFEGTKIFQIIKGARGKDMLAMDKFIELILKVQQLVILYPEIESLDINPAILDKNDVKCVDIKIFVKN